MMGWHHSWRVGGQLPGCDGWLERVLISVGCVAERRAVIHRSGAERPSGRQGSKQSPRGIFCHPACGLQPAACSLQPAPTEFDVHTSTTGAAMLRVEASLSHISDRFAGGESSVLLTYTGLLPPIVRAAPREGRTGIMCRIA